MTTAPAPLRIAFMAVHLQGRQLSPESVAACDRLHTAWTERPFDLVFVCGHEIALDEHGRRSSAAGLAVHSLLKRKMPQVFAINDHTQSSSRRIAACLNIAAHFAAERQRSFVITIMASSRTEALKYAVVLWRGYRLDADILIADTDYRLSRLPHEAVHAYELLVNYLRATNRH